jgi:hypothetical protein
MLCVGEGLVPNPSRLALVNPYPVAIRSVEPIRQAIANNQHTRESLRGGVAPLNGGSGGRNPQIRVLPPLRKSQPTNSHHLPIRLVPAVKHDPYPVGIASPTGEPDVN